MFVVVVVVVGVLYMKQYEFS